MGGRLSRWRYLLLALPFLWQLGLAPWANGVAARPLGIPFAMFWQIAGIVFASACIALLYWMERRAARDGADDGAGDGEGSGANAGMGDGAGGR
ncbi:DUF3311 domain-containing protein [Sphingomonas flavalba]|uniref:DUF3311 domain-containing protein n=1 Tax=Sphingomonas flavalba TaxID=2559804 RepID=UPI00109D91CE|nr:DUF3311 domain-containing protein [Sphingomonas flavalba]